jgi:hypothetical protein
MKFCMIFFYPFLPIWVTCGTRDVDSSLLSDLSFVYIGACEDMLYFAY